MFKKIQISTLLQIAGGTLVVGGCLLWYSQKNVQTKVRNLPHYKESIDIISKHKKALSLLGSPVQLGNVDLYDRKNNFIGKDTSQLRIPISGTFNSGFINIHAQRFISTDEVNKEDVGTGLKAIGKDNFITKSIELEMEDQTILIYEKK
ncbi:Cytochrome oxidase assembly protein 1 family-containing protein [Strongyloides ratti]|uniref:Cytochrome oxidase assembly protein 1 family-containing protein n=1 Tax=Strongyloides ratti TaxID=34506 RepID=A0A090MVM5_STRRB|nr:Cytochrome oxidase assembly protein 1 family-containing protein [Strongyloides ratti]CEF62998.1 Cytochrome oxidase assembly protein 1 family-containing protein [Strongyloides ratti]